MLSALIWIPILGAVLIGVGREPLMPARARLIALMTTVSVFVWTIWLGSQFDAQQAGMQFVEHFAWIEPLGLTYDLGMDGLSLPLVFLNGFLTAIAIASGSPSVNRPRLYFILLLLLNASVTAAFLAQNLLLFFSVL